jgi:hypothetical protein
MKSTLVLLTLVTLSATSAQAQTFETRTQVSVGIPLQTSPEPEDTRPGYDTAMLKVAQLFCLPNHSGVCLETNAILTGGRGLGANLRINFLKVGPVQVHLLDPGVFWNLGKPVSVPNYKRSYDYTFGGGIDFQFGEASRITTNCRAYVPEIGLVMRDGGYAVKAYRKAVTSDIWCDVGYAITW